jgi:hypothetical protein
MAVYENTCATMSSWLRFIRCPPIALRILGTMDIYIKVVALKVLSNCVIPLGISHV